MKTKRRRRRRTKKRTRTRTRRSASFPKKVRNRKANIAASTSGCACVSPRQVRMGNRYHGQLRLDRFKKADLKKSFCHLLLFDPRCRPIKTNQQKLLWSASK